MSGRVLVLGATGRFGAAACEAFRLAGWGVTAQVRPRAAARAPRGSEILETNDRAKVVEAARGTDIVVHALNPRYTDWHKVALPMAYSAIEAAETAGATLMFPGNVYNYGSPLPAVIDTTTPMHPSARKGALRVEIEGRMREAAERGMRTIIVRAGDFFGGGRGSWLDLVIAKDLARGHITYPGPLDIVHTWAYLPDLVAAFVQLAEIREKLGVFESFGFPGHAVSGHDFTFAIKKALRRDFEVKAMSWWLIHALRSIVPMSRELSEMAYLWRESHAIAGGKLQAAIGVVPHTPLDVAMAGALRELGAKSRSTG
jgi:nucleoside-diphosphate-sugar epimerase